MNKTVRIMMYELLITIIRPSYLFTAIGLPLIVGLLFAGLSQLNQGSPNVVAEVFGPPVEEQSLPHGYIDQAGLIQAFPPDFPPGLLVEFTDEAQALHALEDGSIDSYSIIHSDYIQTGSITLVKPDYNPFQSFSGNWRIAWVLNYNLLGADDAHMARVNRTFYVEVTNLEPVETDPSGAAAGASGSDEEYRDTGMLSFYVPYGVTMLFYMVIMFAASLLLNSVTREKENRVIEILMSAVTPTQLLAGKIFGLGLAGLLQTTLWLGTGYALLRLSGQNFDIPAALIPPASILVWALIFFLLGYVLYASLMAAVGALVPNLREASQATIIVIMPMLLSLMFVGVIIEKPHSLMAVILSLFPLTSPVSMMTRLATSSNVPFWHLALSVALLVVTALLVIRLVAGMFRAQTLLSGQSFSMGRLVAALRGKA